MNALFFALLAAGVGLCAASVAAWRRDRQRLGDWLMFAAFVPVVAALVWELRECAIFGLC